MDHADVSNCNQESPSEAWNKLHGSAVGSYLQTKPSHLDHAACFLTEIWVLSYGRSVIQEVKTCQDGSEAEQKQGLFTKTRLEQGSC